MQNSKECEQVSLAVENFDKAMKICRSEILQKGIQSKNLFLFLIMWILENNYLVVHELSQSYQDFSKYLQKQVLSKASELFKNYSDSQNKIPSLLSDDQKSTLNENQGSIPNYLEQSMQLCDQIKEDQFNDYPYKCKTEESPNDNIEESCIMFCENMIHKRMATSTEGGKNKETNESIQQSFAARKEQEIIVDNLQLLKMVSNQNNKPSSPPSKDFQQPSHFYKDSSTIHPNIKSLKQQQNNKILFSSANSLKKGSKYPSTRVGYINQDVASTNQSCTSFQFPNTFNQSSLPTTIKYPQIIINTPENKGIISNSKDTSTNIFFLNEQLKNSLSNSQLLNPKSSKDLSDSVISKSQLGKSSSSKHSLTSSQNLQFAVSPKNRLHNLASLPGQLCNSTIQSTYSHPVKNVSSLPLSQIGIMASNLSVKKTNFFGNSNSSLIGLSEYSSKEVEQIVSSSSFSGTKGNSSSSLYNSLKVRVSIPKQNDLDNSSKKVNAYQDSLQKTLQLNKLINAKDSCNFPFKSTEEPEENQRSNVSQNNRSVSQLEEVLHSFENQANFAEKQEENRKIKELKYFNQDLFARRSQSLDIHDLSLYNAKSAVSETGEATFAFKGLNSQKRLSFILKQDNNNCQGTPSIPFRGVTERIKLDNQKNNKNNN